MVKLLSKALAVLPWSIRTWVRRIPIVASLQRILYDRLAHGSFDHKINAGPANGLVMPITLPEDKLFWTGTWEGDLAKAIRHAVPEGGVCLDIGAYRGFFGGIMALAGASAVHMFEPNPANQERLTRLRELNPQLNLHVHPFAIGAEDTTATFELLEERTMGKLDTSPFETETKQVGAVEVDVRSLDSLIQSSNIPQPDVVKVDIEGAEGALLEGAERLVNKAATIWFIEAHTPLLAQLCSKRLQQAGYEVTVLETSRPWDVMDAPAVCHLVAKPTNIRTC